MEIEAGHLVIELEERYPSFDLGKAVCNHGMFMMAPNRWIPQTRTFQRPLRLADATTSVTVSISQQVRSDSPRLLIRVHDPHPRLTPRDYQVIAEQVRRMLRISERDERMMNKFHKVHPLAKQDGFGRIFRSPTIFEDAVKIILLCYCNWERTLKIVRGLCRIQRKIGDNEWENQRRQPRRNRDDQELEDDDGLLGNFPSAREIIFLGKKDLREHGKVGYRAAWILELAQKVVDGGERDVLGKLESMAMTAEPEFLMPMKGDIKGMGDFAFSALLMCVGVYNLVPADSETIRHMRTVRTKPAFVSSYLLPLYFIKQEGGDGFLFVWMDLGGKVHAKTGCSDLKTANEEAKKVYAKYEPFQSLAYW